jgi:hypothetical protein
MGSAALPIKERGQCRTAQESLADRADAPTWPTRRPGRRADRVSQPADRTGPTGRPTGCAATQHLPILVYEY